MPDEIIEIMQRGFRELSPPESGDNRWVVEWVLKRKGQLDSTRQAIKNRYKELMADLDKEEIAIDNYYGPVVQAEADKLIQKQRGKKKSAKLLTGTVGYREQPDKLIIHNMEAAIAWAYGHFPKEFNSVVKDIDTAKARKMLSSVELWEVTTSLYKEQLMEYVKATGDVPDGCEYVVGEDKFFAKPVKLELPKGTE